jgi:hypothetical protein
MVKFDKIFFSACGIFAIGIVLAIMGYNMAVIFIVGAYLLRPTLHAFNLVEGFADERQILNHSRSGNIAFIVVMLTVVGLALSRITQGEKPDDFYLILTFGIAARAITGLMLHGDLRKTGSLLIIIIGLVFAVFGLASARFSYHGLLVGLGGLVFSSLGLFARKFPRVVSSIVALIAAIFIIQLKLYLIGEAKSGMLIVVAFLLFAAGCLFLSSRSDSDSEARSRKTAMKLMVGAGSAFVLFYLISLGVKAHNPVIKASSGEIIKGPIEVRGLSCEVPVKYHPNGNLRSCFLAREDTLSDQPFPKGTLLFFNESGDLRWCYLSKDAEIQGHLCKGKEDGFRTKFYNINKLQRIWLAQDEIIDNVPCAKYSYFSRNDVTFHENGRLQSCKLSQDFTIGQITLKKGDDITLDDQGNLVGGE